MNESLAILLTIAMYIMIFFVAVLLVFGFGLLLATYKFKKRITKIVNAVNHAVAYNEPVRLDGVYISHAEAEQVKAYLRANKERDASDSEIIDRATEYHRDFRST